MPILLLKVISLHILAAIQTAFPPRGADLVAQRSLFCHRLFCHDLQRCLLHGNEKVTNIPLTSPRRREKQVLLYNRAKWGGQLCTLENIISRAEEGNGWTGEPWGGNLPSSRLIFRLHVPFSQHTADGGSAISES